MRCMAIGFAGAEPARAGDVRRWRKAHDGAKLDPLLRRGAVAGRLARALEWRSLAPARARTDRSSWPAPRRRAALLGRAGPAGPPLPTAALRPEERRVGKECVSALGSRGDP